MPPRWTHATVLTAAITALAVSGWKVSLVVISLQDWNLAWDQPKIAGELIQAAVYGLVAFGLGLGLNFSSLLRGFGLPLPPPAPPEP